MNKYAEMLITGLRSTFTAQAHRSASPHSTPCLAAVALAALALMPSAAEAKDCYILVHGHMTTNAVAAPADAEAYWTRFGDFAGRVTHNASVPNTSNYGIVRWDAGDASANAFWEPATAFSVAYQILSLANGGGDGLAHGNQCALGDRIFVVAHSQGAQVLTYINGNAYPGAPNFDKAIVADTQEQIAGAQKVDAPFSAAMSKVSAIFTIGAATNGTEGMDEYCQLAAATSFANIFKRCIPSLRTYERYSPRNYTGETLLKPMYALGGWSHLSGLLGVTSLTLDGQDDGVINLASQMNCAGSPQQNLKEDLTNGSFVCSRGYKRHSTNSLNLASIDVNHDDERGATTSFIKGSTSARDTLSCGYGKDMAGTIRACVVAGLPGI